MHGLTSLPLFSFFLSAGGTLSTREKVRYYRVTGKSLEFPRLKILIVVISTGCLLCAILFLLSLAALLEGTNSYYSIPIGGRHGIG